LHVESAEGDTHEELVSADNEGGPERTDFRLLLNGENGAQNSSDPDVIVLLEDGGAMPLFRYFLTESNGGIYRETETSKIVYLAFAFEAVSGEGNNVSRQDVISSILTWFNGGSGVPDLANHGQPVAFQVLEAYPNPFNPTVNVDLVLPSRGLIKAEIFDLSGRLVSTQSIESKTAGFRTFSWNAEECKSGTYFLKFTGPDGITHSQKVLLLK